MPKFIDVHAHLHDKAYDEDRARVLLEMEQKEIFAITVGTDITESKKAVALAEEHPHLFATVGQHPVDKRDELFLTESYRDLLAHPKVLALGECGLDYFRLEEDKEKGFIVNLDDEVDRQRQLFETQIDLAVEFNKPLMLHGRPSKGTMDAYEDMIHMLASAKRKYGDRLRGNFHFFVGNVDIARQVLALEFTMSFSGVVTFAKEFEEVLKFVPIDMMHAETDSPYAAPMPYRGKRNLPVYVEEIVKKIAETKGLSIEEVQAQLLANAQRVFGF
jgi:TatD DNase family protein